MQNRRLHGLDILKVIATVYVALLHVCGYAFDMHQGLDVAQGVVIAEYILKAIAYPAIHIFVLIGSWFMIEKSPAVQTILKIYFQSWIVCIGGLVICLFFNWPRDAIGVVRCLLPFSGRAYWFVTEYILLMLLSPTLNVFICNIEKEKLLRFTALYAVIISLYPIIPGETGWMQNYSNIGLFVFLYFVAACLKRSKQLLQNKYVGAAMQVFSFCLLVLSAGGGRLLSEHVPFFQGKEKYLYQYCSPLVIGEAIGIFIVFYNVQLRPERRSSEKAIVFLASGSLVSYLIHMHPIIKNLYTSLGIFGFMKTQSGVIFAVKAVAASVAVMIMGAVANTVITRLASSMADLVYRIAQKVCHKNKLSV